MTLIPALLVIAASHWLTSDADPGRSGGGFAPAVLTPGLAFAGMKGLKALPRDEFRQLLRKS